jgi:hypothetical protein
LACGIGVQQPSGEKKKEKLQNAIN